MRILVYALNASSEAKELSMNHKGIEASCRLSSFRFWGEIAHDMNFEKDFRISVFD